MRCLYRQRIHDCGDYREIEIFPVFAKSKSRRARYKPTSEMQSRLNQVRAERALTRILNANFSSEDISVTLTYDDKHLPEDYEQAERDARNFIRRIKRLRKKMDLPDIKYVMIPGPGRFHFHIPMSGGVPDKELQRLWPYGYANATHFEFNENGLEGLAKYICTQYDEDQYGGEDLLSMLEVDEETGEVTERSDKRKKGKRRYSCSSNIIRPSAEERDGEISASRVEELATVDSKARAAFEKMYPGYCLSDCRSYYNAANGGYYLLVKMYSAGADFLEKRKRYRRWDKSPRACP